MNAFATAKREISEADMSRQANAYLAGAAPELMRELAGKHEADGLDAAIELLESLAETTIGGIVGDGDKPLTIIMSRNTLYAEDNNGNREEINAPKPETFAEAIKIVSQLYSGKDWALEIYE